MKTKTKILLTIARALVILITITSWAVLLWMLLAI